MVKRRSQKITDDAIDSQDTKGQGLNMYQILAKEAGLESN